MRLGGVTQAARAERPDDGEGRGSMSGLDATEAPVAACGLTEEALLELLRACDVPAYRAGQIRSWIFERGVMEWGRMTNVPAALRERLESSLPVLAGHVERVEGQAPGTRKLLVGLRDGEAIETVLIPAAERRTVCVSSQAGCRWACAFCASGMGGFRRNLGVDEIVTQVLLARELYGDRPTHVVFMGMGEPMDNYDAVMAAVRILNDPRGVGIGARRITISTCGLAPGIARLAEEGMQVELSVSLHATDDALRSRLVPANRRYPLADVMAACRAFTRRTKRIVTFEYTLIKGVNDSRREAEALARLVKPVGGRVNLIPLSPVAEFEGEAPEPAVAEMFVSALARAGVNATLRLSKGSGLSAACGQLRGRVAGEAAREGAADGAAGAGGAA